MNNKRPFIHAFVYSESGGGKSTFASLWPKNSLVICFDPFGKDMPYLKNASSVTDIQKWQINDKLIISYRDATYPDGTIRIEYYHDHDEDQAVAYEMFLARMKKFKSEYENWNSIIIDSVTMMELAARKREELVLNKLPSGVDSKYQKGSQFDGRTWFGGSTDALENMLVRRLAGIPMNVLITCHIHERQNMANGEIYRGPYTPGRLYSRNLIGAAFQEQYFMYKTRDEHGDQVYMLQTQNRDGWQATSQIDAPDPLTPPSYEGLWSNWDNRGNNLKKGEENVGS